MSKNLPFTTEEIKQALKEKRGWNITGVRISKIQEREGTVVAKLLLDLSDGDRKTVWAKKINLFYHSKDENIQMGRKEYDVLNVLYDKFNNIDKMNVTKPLAYLPANNVFLTEHSEGKNLHVLIKKQDVDLGRYLYYAGKWLAVFHASTLTGEKASGEELEMADKERLEKDIKELKRMGSNRTLLKTVSEYLYDKSAEIRGMSFESVGSHVDFAPRNILVKKDGSITGIDFAGYCNRSFYDNLGMFLAFMDTFRRYPLLDVSNLEELKSHFITGYKEESGKNISPDVLEYFKLRYLIRMFADEKKLTSGKNSFMRKLILGRMKKMFENLLTDSMKNIQRTPFEKNMTFYHYGIPRGEKMFQLLNREVKDLNTERALDVGFGAAGISIGFSRHYDDVASLDLNENNIRIIRKRIEERDINNISYIHGSALELPFQNDSFDLVIMNGVLEWVGVGRKESALKLQGKVMDRVYDLLRDRGIFYMAIENRWSPLYFIRDPHVFIPLVCAFPRKLADLVSYILLGRHYDAPIPSFWQLKRDFKRHGFREIHIYAPVMNYQYPLILFDLINNKVIHHGASNLDEVADEYKRVGMVKRVFLKKFFWEMIWRLRLIKLFTNSFIVFGRK